ncbi:hypothetical protein BD413DRAFT_571175 [Trametes elegans]|nr:hypothetical protein BD413DRAFT_571175 [Trametes elegans]
MSASSLAYRSSVTQDSRMPRGATLEAPDSVGERTSKLECSPYIDVSPGYGLRTCTALAVFLSSFQHMYLFAGPGRYSFMLWSWICRQAVPLMESCGRARFSHLIFLTPVSVGFRCIPQTTAKRSTLPARVRCVLASASLLGACFSVPYPDLATWPCAVASSPA